MKTIEKTPDTTGKPGGISIRTLSSVMVIAAVLSVCLAFFGLYRTVDHAHSLYGLEQERQTCDMAIQQLMDGSDYLTLQVQQFVIHSDRSYMDNYWDEVNETKSRDGALDIILSLPLTDAEHRAAIDGKRESDSLMNTEIYAMRLVCESINMPETEMPAAVAAQALSAADTALSADEKRSAAVTCIFGPDYSLSKSMIRISVNAFRSETSNRYAGDALTVLRSTERATLLMALGLAVFFVFLLGSIYCFISQVMTPLVSFSATISKGEGKSGRPITLRERGALELRRFANSFNSLTAALDKNTRRLSRLGYVDYLTDVPNRAGITEYVSEKIAGKLHPLGLLMIDIDNFKRFNDTYGHALGDLVLRQVSSAICTAAPEGSGISGRLCGEEFIVVYKGANAELLSRLAEIVLENVRSIEGKDVGLADVPDFKITVSVGGVIWDGAEPVNFTSLLSQADSALYISKNSGKNRYTYGGVFTVPVKIKAN